MKIENITIKNFRCFEELTVSFDDRLTILVGKNGSGKSAILDAVTVAIGTFISELKMKTFGIRKGDARNVCYSLGSGLDIQAQYPVSIEAKGNVGGRNITWKRELRSKSGHTATTDAKEFKSIIANYTKQVAQGDSSLVLPIVSYYGTGRLWAQMREKQKAPLEKTSRLNGYLDSLDAAANNKLMLQWFRKITLRDLQQKQTSPELQVVKQAIVQCFKALTGTSEIDVKFNLDSLEIEIEYTDASGERKAYSLEQLSDGYKSAISLIADIAYRMAMLNPQLLDQILLETPGVVLIDEIDLHLHPEWQHQILHDLMTIFPKIQFIVSSHAPAVIQSCKEGHLVILENGAIQRDRVQAYGRDTNSIMTEIMEVPTRPESIKKQFDEFYDKMNKNQYLLAEEILDKLSSILGEDDYEVTACRINLQLEQIS